MANGMCSLHKIAWVLIIIGAINWGLMGIFNFNLVEAIFGQWDIVVRIIYTLVGISALASFTCGQCKACKK